MCTSPASSSAPMCSVEARRAHRTLLRGKLLALKAELVTQISREINDSSEVSRLPTELLEKIFLHVTTGSDWQHTKSLLAITHVCHRWRMLARGSRHMWTKIRLPSHPELVKATLRRSAGVLLDVGVFWNGECTRNLGADDDDLVTTLESTSLEFHRNSASLWRLLISCTKYSRDVCTLSPYASTFIHCDCAIG